MTVAQLILALQQHDSALPVFITAGHSYQAPVIIVYKFLAKGDITTPYVLLADDAVD
jgi:hypothetical protein